MGFFSLKYDEMTDFELAKKLSSNKKESEQAFAVIYSRHSQKLYAYIIKIVGDSATANDLFQDTFFKFFDSLKNKSEFENIIAYLFRIARNLCLNHKRDRKMNHSYLDDYKTSSINEYSYESTELHEIVDKALNDFEFDEKEAFVLRVYNGFTYPEIAEILGLDDLTALRMQVFRTKEKLKKILEPYLNDLNF